jgi:hypothetical protein
MASPIGIATVNPQAAVAAGSTESAVASRIASSMGLATAKPSMTPMLVRNAGHQDDVVSPQLASVALPIGMATTKPTATPMVMM